MIDDIVSVPFCSQFERAMQDACWPGDAIRRYRRMSQGAQRTFEAEVKRRSKSLHPRDQKYRRLYGALMAVRMQDRVQEKGWVRSWLEGTQWSRAEMQKIFNTYAHDLCKAVFAGPPFNFHNLPKKP